MLIDPVNGVFGNLFSNPFTFIILVGFFAIFHGHAHGTELPPGQSGLLYSMGFIFGTGCLHAVGIIIGLIHRWSVGKLLLRGGGALIALMGGIFLWQAIV